MDAAPVSGNAVANWFSQHSTLLEEVGIGTGFATIIILSIALFFTWLLSQKAQKWGMQRIKLPLGIEMTFGVAMDIVMKQVDSDSLTLNSISETVKQLEYDGISRMRHSAAKLINSYAHKYPDQRNFILRSNLPLSYIIADNHIMSSLSVDKFNTYISAKQYQVLYDAEIVAPHFAGSPANRHVLEKLVREFIVDIIPVQLHICTEKIKAYKKALSLLQMNGNRLRCQLKIEKNEGYIADIRELEESFQQMSRIEPYSGVISISAPPDIVLDGESLMEQHLNTSNRLFRRELALGDDSTIVRNPVNKMPTPS